MRRVRIVGDQDVGFELVAVPAEFQHHAVAALDQVVDNRLGRVAGRPAR